MLAVDSHNSSITEEGRQFSEDSKFQRIYNLLLNGSTRKAVEVARDARLYNLSMLIALYNIPPGLEIQAQALEQVLNTN